MLLARFVGRRRSADAVCRELLRKSIVIGTWTGYPLKGEPRDGWERIELEPE
jgi:hypothetical protein